MSLDALDSLRDFKVARISLRSGSLSLGCVIRVAQAPFMEVRFSSEEPLPADLAPGDLCQIACEEGMNLLLLRAHIEKIQGRDGLLLCVEDSTSKGDPRRHFRVDAEVSLRCWPIFGDRPERPLEEVVNISGGGIRFVTPDRFKKNQKVRLEMVFPGGVRRPIVCTCKVIAFLQRAEGDSEVSLKIIEIKEDQLRRLLEFCVGIKFREMRHDVEFLGEVLKPR